MPLLKGLGLRHRFLNGTDHVEGLLGKGIEFAAEDTLEPADGVLERDNLSVLAREHLRDVERLRQEALYLTSAEHDQLVFFRQLVHAQDRDDVLQLLVALKHSLHTASGVVVLFTNNQRIELTAGGVQRIHRRVNTQRRNLTGQHDGRV